MDLESKDAAHCAALGIVINHFRHGAPIDHMAQLVAVGGDCVAVKLLDIHTFQQCFGVASAAGDFLFATFRNGYLLATLGQYATPTLFIKDTGIAASSIDIGLVTAHHILTLVLQVL